MTTALTLTFKDTTFKIVDRDGSPWLRGPQIADALQMRDRRGIHDLYNRHADEFTESMTAVVELQTAGGKQAVRIFNLRGCHLLAILARTAVAKEFRRWVLDILDRETTAGRAGTVTIAKDRYIELLEQALNRATAAGGAFIPTVPPSPVVPGQVRPANPIAMRGSVLEWWLDCLRRGHLMTIEGVPTWPVVPVIKRALHNEYLIWCQEHEVQHPVHEVMFAKRMREFGARPTRPRNEDYRAPCWLLPALDHARRQIRRQFGYDVGSAMA